MRWISAVTNYNRSVKDIEKVTIDYTKQWRKTIKLTSLHDLPAQAVSHNQAIEKKVMLRSGDLPHLTNFSIARFAPGQVAPGHAHRDMCEVFFVWAGSGVIRIDGQEYSLAPGSCVAVEPQEVHEIVNNGSTDLVLTYFGLRVEPIAANNH